MIFTKKTTPKNRIKIPRVLYESARTLQPPQPPPFGPIYTRQDMLEHASEFIAIDLPILPEGRTDEPTTSVLLFPHMKEQILAMPKFGLSTFKPVDSTKYIIEYRGDIKGTGLYATEDIGPGAPIVCERPLIAYPSFLPRDKAGHTTKYLEIVLGRLPREDQKKFLGLYNAWSRRQPNIRGIAETNAFEISPLPGCEESFSVVCDHISMANHSCSANAHFRFDPKTFSAKIEAKRKIKAGDEITISYYPASLEYASRAVRQTYLKKHHGFTCRCPTCTLDEGPSQQSDQRRAWIGYQMDEAIASLRTSSEDSDVDDWCLNRPGSKENRAQEIIAECKLIFDEMEKEGIKYPRTAGILMSKMCRLYCALGNEKQAKYWAMRTANLCHTYHSHDGRWYDVHDNLQNTNYWELRKLDTPQAMDRILGVDR